MIDVKENVPLAHYTSFGVGGPARFFVSVSTQDELSWATRFADEHDIPLLVLVGGSNVLVSDDGFPGLVLRVEMKGYEERFEGGTVVIRVGAGEQWDAFVAYCVNHGWRGIESLSGIPGSVGAAPVQNIGAYGVSVAPFVREVEVFDRRNGMVTVLGSSVCHFGYRDSIFKHPEGSSYIITHVTFQLERSPRASIPPYHDLKERFGEQTECSLSDLRQAILKIRAAKGMVIMPGYEQLKSAGSFFKNPTVEADDFDRVQSIIRSHPDGSCADPWFWSQGDGRVKVSAACLLECAGFPKGFRQGAVGISPRHALALINHGGARASDIAALAATIQKKVRDLFGVSLEREVQYIGF